VYPDAGASNAGIAATGRQPGGAGTAASRIDLTFGPLIDAARQSQYESHVSEAKMTALLLADARGAAIEATVDEAIKNLDILVQRRASAYSIADDRTIEQTIWIAHLSVHTLLPRVAA
jgi:hypothetical protein